MHRPIPRSRNRAQAFTLVECMVATAVCAIVFLGTLGLLGFARMSNELEQERARAHQIVCQEIEVKRLALYSAMGDPEDNWRVSNSEPIIWDNGTPDDPSDDIKGSLAVTIRNAETGQILESPPNPAILVSVEATVSWRSVGRFSNRTLRETAMTLKSP